jgi:hypothetical protein
VARESALSNGRQRLEEAMAVLLLNQAAMVQNQTATLARLEEMERLTAERFARIEADMTMVLRVLDEHGRCSPNTAAYSPIMVACSNVCRRRFATR